MNVLSQSVGFPQTMRAYCQLLQKQRGGIVFNDDYDSILAQYGLLPSPMRFFAEDGLRPAVTWFSRADQSVILIDGIKSNPQATALWNGYKPSGVFPDAFPVNRYLRDTAEAIRVLLDANGWRATGNTTYAGYSAGGAIAQWLSLLHSDNGQAPGNNQVIAIGSPRVANYGDRLRINGRTFIVRWFNDNDPVPIVPPRRSESTNFALFNGLRNSTNMDQFGHAGQGIQIAADGTLSFQELPTGTLTFPASDFVAWFLGRYQTPSAHLLDEYLRRVPFQEQQPPPSSRHSRQPPVEPQASNDAAANDAAMRRTALVIANAERQQNAVPVNIPKPQVVTARKIGRVWGIYFGDVLIVVRQGRRAAHTVARSLNLFLERIQNAALVAPDALLNAMNLYLQAASDPAGGFTPVMNVRLTE